MGTTLYRPVGPAELALIEASSFRRFPPRLPEQPIFYPVLTAEYATIIARDWNAKGPDGAGYVTAFEIDSDYLERYEIRRVGSSDHLEYWIPAEKLEEFNDQIQGEIRIVAEFFRRCL
jgi:hypothetical protein